MADLDELLREASLSLDEAITQRNQKANLETALARASQRRDREAALLAEWEAELRREERKLQAMENPSLQGIFQTLLGKKEDNLRTARQRHLAIRHKHARSRQTIESLKRQIEEFERQSIQFEGVEERYQALVEEKENLLLKRQDETAARLYELAEDLRLARFKLKKIDQAVEAGKLVQQGLSKVADEINDIDPNWEAFGNQLLVKVSRQEHITEAWALIRQVEPLLRMFQRELRVVAPLLGHHNETFERFQKTAAMFLLDVRREATTPPRIAQVVHGSVTMYRQVEEIMESLLGQITIIHKRIDRLSEDRQSLIESA